LADGKGERRVWSSSSWPVIKDIAATVTGLSLVISQALSPHPVPWLAGCGVVLTGGVASFKVGKVISAVIDGRSGSPPSTPPGPQPGSSSSQQGPVVTDE
jgi:hypothetical protein